MKSRNRHFFLFVCLTSFFWTTQGQSQLDSIPPLLLLGKAEVPKQADYSLLPEVAKAFDRMANAAQKEGILLSVVSSFRSYKDQRRIWNRKYKRFVAQGLSPDEAIKKIITYSTLPGTSRHHWGTDLDLVDAKPLVKGDVLLDSLFTQGPYRKLNEWLTANSEKFGFYLVYTKDTLRPGFYYEPWHFSYRKLSLPFLEAYQKFHLLDSIAKDSLLLGHQHITPMFKSNYLQQHILGINPCLLPD